MGLSFVAGRELSGLLRCFREVEAKFAEFARKRSAALAESCLRGSTSASPKLRCLKKMINHRRHI